MVESEASAALVCLVMKLSEVELRPLFLHLCEWKGAGVGEGEEVAMAAIDRRLAFYRVLDGLAMSLKVGWRFWRLYLLNARCWPTRFTSHT